MRARLCACLCVCVCARACVRARLQFGELFLKLEAGLGPGDVCLPGRGVAVLACGPAMMQVRWRARRPFERGKGWG